MMKIFSKTPYMVLFQFSLYSRILLTFEKFFRMLWPKRAQDFIPSTGIKHIRVTSSLYIVVFNNRRVEFSAMLQM
jgi:hypothetical protein